MIMALHGDSTLSLSETASDLSKCLGQQSHLSSNSSP